MMKSRIAEKKEYLGKMVVDMTQDEMLENVLDAFQRQEFVSLANRISELSKDEEGDNSTELELASLSNDELEIVERYNQLKELAREKMDRDLI